MVWGPIPQIAALKFGDPNSSHLREKLGVGGSFPICKALCQCGIYHKNVSQPSLPISMWVFSYMHNVGITQLIYGFLSEGIDVCVAVYSVPPWKEGNSGPSYFAIFLTLPNSTCFKIPFKSIQGQAKPMFGQRSKQWLPLELLTKRGSTGAFKDAGNIPYPWLLQGCVQM